MNRFTAEIELPDGMVSVQTSYLTSQAPNKKAFMEAAARLYELYLKRLNLENEDE